MIDKVLAILKEAFGYHKKGHVVVDKVKYTKDGDVEQETIKIKTFDEWIIELERINARNLMETNCLMVTSIQWNELKQIIQSYQSVLDKLDVELKYFEQKTFNA